MNVIFFSQTIPAEVMNIDFFVSMGNFSLAQTDVISGAPQGSILGSFLFNTYMFPLLQDKIFRLATITT